MCFGFQLSRPVVVQESVMCNNASSITEDWDLKLSHSVFINIQYNVLSYKGMRHANSFCCNDEAADFSETALYTMFHMSCGQSSCYL
jgi:hypothetical protein